MKFTKLTLPVLTKTSSPYLFHSIKVIKFSTLPWFRQYLKTTSYLNKTSFFLRKVNYSRYTSIRIKNLYTPLFLVTHSTNFNLSLRPKTRVFKLPPFILSFNLLFFINTFSIFQITQLKLIIRLLPLFKNILTSSTFPLLNTFALPKATTNYLAKL